MKLILAGALALVSCLVAPLALAADSTSVSLPIGDWLQQLVAIAQPLAVTVLAGALALLPASVVSMIKTSRIDQLLQSAIGYGINAVADAEKGKVLSVDTGNAVVAAALQYAIDHGAPALIKWAGGADAIRQKILARVTVEPGAAIVTGSGATLTKATPKPAAAPSQ